MLSVDAATTSAERFAFIPVAELISGDRGIWMECLKAFLAATQLLDQDPIGTLAILNALGEAPLLRYLAWCGSADPTPLFQFHNDQAFLLETREATEAQRQDFFSAVAQDLGQGPIGAKQVEHFWEAHSTMVLQTFQRLATLAARACQRMGDIEGREQWCHQAIMASAIFDFPVPDDLLELAEPDEWSVGETPISVRFIKRWQLLTTSTATVH